MTNEERRFLEKLLSRLGMDPGLAAVVTLERALDLIKENVGDTMADAAIKHGILRRDERAWFLDQTREMGIGVMRSFLKQRAEMQAKFNYFRHIAPVPDDIDEVQERINKQVGVSREVFLKYNRGSRKS